MEVLVQGRDAAGPSRAQGCAARARSAVSAGSIFFFSIDLERKQNLLHSVFFEQRARGAHPILGGDTRVSCSGGVSVQIAGGHFHSWV